jgi:hypothetical protein
MYYIYIYVCVDRCVYVYGHTLTLACSWERWEMGVLVLLAVLGVVRVGLGGSDLSVCVYICVCVYR